MLLLEVPCQVLDRILEILSDAYDISSLASCCTTLRNHVKLAPLRLSCFKERGSEAKPVSVQLFRQLASTWRGICHLDVSGTAINQDEIQSLLRTLPKLESMVMDRCQKIDSLTDIMGQHPAGPCGTCAVGQEKKNEVSDNLSYVMSSRAWCLKVLSAGRCFNLSAQAVAQMLTFIASKSDCQIERVEEEEELNEERETSAQLGEVRCRMEECRLDEGAEAKNNHSEVNSALHHIRGGHSQCSSSLSSSTHSSSSSLPLRVLLLSHLMDIDRHLQGALLLHVTPSRPQVHPSNQASLLRNPNPKGQSRLCILALHNCRFASPDGSGLFESLAEVTPQLMVLMLGGSATANVLNSRSASHARFQSSQGGSLDLGSRAGMTGLRAVLTCKHDEESVADARMAAVMDMAEKAVQYLPQLMVLEVSLMLPTALAERTAQSALDQLGIRLWDLSAPHTLQQVEHLLRYNGDLACSSGYSSGPCAGAGSSLGSALMSRLDDPHLHSLRVALTAAANCSGFGRVTPLHVATERGDLASVCCLVSLGAGLEAKDSRGTTALFLAAEAGHARIAQQLLAAGANAMARNNAGENPLYIAALRGHAAVLEALVLHCKHARLPWQSAESYGDGWTPLMAAVVAQREDIVKQLLLHADPQCNCLGASYRANSTGASLSTGSSKPEGLELFSDSSNSGSSSSVSSGSSSGESISSTEFKQMYSEANRTIPQMGDLEECKADSLSDDIETRWKSTFLCGNSLKIEPSSLISASNQYGQTALHIVARRGFVPLLQILLSAGADLNRKDTYGLTPVAVARNAKQQEVVQLLSEATVSKKSRQSSEHAKRRAQSANASKSKNAIILSEATEADGGKDEVKVDVIEVAPGRRLSRRRSNRKVKEQVEMSL